ncbi:sulfite exporter TauE/SafE family protein [Streptomyces sp. DSM 44915]|uniref:Probable membrane transporter protein n=1 Tax=Streptomyces chisholmiae TaxID=3075540 RepID=A0ABU2JYZ0_9ACTN|nr:sulfite exporter TauE/SafE family protein [Streptomyces sp. DSM 44915]MDT0270226.1 sulfite exporter TauE/SafE family protein [Streptomyces sp. DSM 44915]
MTEWVQWPLIAAAGFWAGMINVVVGSGTLVTFPTLTLFGYPPLVANVSNNIGLVGGGLSGTFGYRAELAGQRRLVRALLPASLLGGVAGALLLLLLPAEAFGTIVPLLVAAGLVMVVAGPAVRRRAERRRAGAEPRPPTGRRLAGVAAAVFGLGIYGGYFGAAQGILIVGLLSVLTSDSLQTITGLKNLLTTGVNAVAAVTFMLVTWEAIDWVVVALIATGATAGGLAGARFGRRLSPGVLRGLIVVVGGVALVNMVFFD